MLCLFVCFFQNLNSEKTLFQIRLKEKHRYCSAFYTVCVSESAKHNFHEGTQTIIKCLQKKDVGPLSETWLKLEISCFKLEYGNINSDPNTYAVLKFLMSDK